MPCLGRSGWPLIQSVHPAAGGLRRGRGVVEGCAWRGMSCELNETREDDQDCSIVKIRSVCDGLWQGELYCTKRAPIN